MTLICRVCGAPTEDGRCTLCGSSLVEQTATPVGAPPQVPPPPPPPPAPFVGPDVLPGGPASPQSSRRPLIVMGAIAALAVVGITGWVVSHILSAPQSAQPINSAPPASSPVPSSSSVAPGRESTRPTSPPSAPSESRGATPLSGQFAGDLVQTGNSPKTWYTEFSFTGTSGRIAYRSGTTQCEGTLLAGADGWQETITSGPCTTRGTWSFALAGDTLAGWYSSSGASDYSVSGTAYRVSTVSSSTAPQQPTYPLVRVAAGKECSRSGAGPFAASGTSNATTSCPFAINVREAYIATLNGADGQVQAYSPTTKLWYDMNCSGSQPVLCTGGRAGRVIIYGGDLKVG